MSGPCIQVNEGAAARLPALVAAAATLRVGEPETGATLAPASITAFPVHPVRGPRLIDLFKARLAQGHTADQAAATLGYDRQFGERMMARIAREESGHAG